MENVPNEILRTPDWLVDHRGGRLRRLARPLWRRALRGPYARRGRGVPRDRLFPFAPAGKYADTERPRRRDAAFAA